METSQEKQSTQRHRHTAARSGQTQCLHYGSNTHEAVPAVQRTGGAADVGVHRRVCAVAVVEVHHGAVVQSCGDVRVLVVVTARSVVIRIEEHAQSRPRLPMTQYCTDRRQATRRACMLD